MSGSPSLARLASLDPDADTLPNAWEFATTGATAASGDNGASGAPDHDGFTNIQQWKAKTDPRNATSYPGAGATRAANAIMAAAGLTPTNWARAAVIANERYPDDYGFAKIRAFLPAKLQRGWEALKHQETWGSSREN
jgi:hypothetical protein